MTQWGKSGRKRRAMRLISTKDFYASESHRLGCLCPPYFVGFGSEFISGGTDSTIAPPQKTPAILFNERFVAARRKERFFERKIFTYFVVCKGHHRSMASGWQGALYSKRCGRERVPKPAISLKKSSGDYRRTTRSVLCCVVWSSHYTDVSTHLPPAHVPMPRIKAERNCNQVQIRAGETGKIYVFVHTVGSDCYGPPRETSSVATNKTYTDCICSTGDLAVGSANRNEQEEDRTCASQQSKHTRLC